MQIIVVGNTFSKRIEYFLEAGSRLQTKVCFMTYDELIDCLPVMRQAVVKLEPWVSDETDFLKYARWNEKYMETLRQLGEQKLADDVHFLNTPQTLLQALDKRETKRRLSAVGLGVTPLLASPRSIDELITHLSKCVRGGFLKPRFGSGAGGIMAIRYQPRLKKWAVFTTLQRVDGIIRNTKRIHHLCDSHEIMPLAEAVMQTDAILEEWIPKELWQGEKYDLRVVCSDSEIDYIVVRCSKGSITNLHLNNNARLWSELALPEEVQHEIYRQCKAAVRTLGLSYAGVDVLLEKDTGIPYIIEVNGQGDHIYQDMYADNSIYARQIKTIQQRYEHTDR